MTIHVRHVRNCSVRIPDRLRKFFDGKEVVRFSINPILYERSRNIVRWRREDPGAIPPISVLQRAVRTYPQFRISHAIEAVLIDLLLEQQPANELTSADLEHMKRFSALSLSEKIRVTQKRNRAYHTLKRLSWHGTGNRI